MLLLAQKFFVDKIVLIKTDEKDEMNLENIISDIKQVSQQNVKISVLIAESCSKDFVEKFFNSVNKPLLFVTTGLNSTKVIKEVKKQYRYLLIYGRNVTKINTICSISAKVFQSQPLKYIFQP